MRRATIAFVCVLVAIALTPPIAGAKKTRDRIPENRYVMDVPARPANPSEIQALIDQRYTSPPADTTVLGWWQFDSAVGGPDEQGWAKIDRTAELDSFFHVDGSGAAGPNCCPITPINGEKSMWCGRCLAEGDPYCSWAELPGYGNNWDQSLESQTLVCTTLTFSYTAVWESEPGYDLTYVQYWDGVQQDWMDLPVNGGTGYYDGVGGPLFESFVITPPDYATRLRFRFVSDTGWSDEDGLWDSNEGAFKVDDITVSCPDVGGSFDCFEDWEDEMCGQKGSNDMVWGAVPAPGFGIYAQLHPAMNVVQEDPCKFLNSHLWGFFDDPAITNYGCGGWWPQGAMPYGPDENGLYLWNQIWSPWIPNQGSGNQYELQFLTYRDLPLDNLQFYTFEIHAKDATTNCPYYWPTYRFVYYGDQKDWIRTTFEVGAFIPASTDSIRVVLDAIDLCKYWCGLYGTGSCHSHAPLFDQVRLVRIGVQGPQWSVRHIDLFNDNFPEDGDITCQSFARADMAIDMLPYSSPGIIPGDSAVVEVDDPSHVYTPIGETEEPDPSIPPQVYCWVRVGSHLCTPGHTPTSIQSPDNTRYPGDPMAGALRYPYLGSMTCGPWTYWKHQCDFVYSAGGGLVSDRYCIDLMDIYNGLHTVEDPAGNVGEFVPGDTIYYFFEAVPNDGPPSYWHRDKVFRMGQGASNTTLSWDEACHQPCEFMILPDSGRLPEGDILFVDDCDDRGGPAELYFDWVLATLWLMCIEGERLNAPFYATFSAYVDIFDVLGPSSFVGNSLASRVKDFQRQLIGDPEIVYQNILWNTGDLRHGLVGDGSPSNFGSGPEKSDDWTLLHLFMDNHPDNPGNAFFGDDLAEEWVTLTGPGAVTYRGNWMSFNLLSGDHVAWGEAPSPTVYGDLTESLYVVFDNLATPPAPPRSDYWVAFGGCPSINDFDVLAPSGPLCSEQVEYPSSGDAAILAQATANMAGSTARCVLSGHAFNYIRYEIPALDSPPHHVTLDHTEVMRDILIWLEKELIEPVPVGLDPLALTNRLHNAYPNPFNPTTTIRYTIKNRAHVSLKIYNVAGQLVRTVVDDTQTPKEGGFASEWDGSNDQGQPVSSGVYFYKLSTKGFSQTKKMVLLK
ncbi:MAG: T9SS type A sorting domain-containing protein [Candidatus Latescibacterota bacterium]|nr:MAG: T9SS type A sorting domain-containing protein [Candidatus Latescibacterota bacterium]